MANMITPFTFFLALVLTVCSAILRPRSSSSGAGVAEQTCGADNRNFYCPLDGACKPREQRCTGSNVCPYPSATAEQDCYPTASPGQYQIRLGHAQLFGGFGSRKRQYALEHQFVLFRGLTYEFGKSYGVQILDTIDPLYKYKDGRDLTSDGIERVGSSYCTWQDATRFADSWDTRYSLSSNNCQHFADKLIEFLTNDQCNRPPTSSGKRRKRREDQQAYIDELIREAEAESPCSGTSAESASWAVALLVAASMASLLY